MEKRKLPSLVAILILTLVTALAWVGLSVYRAITTSPEPSVSEDVLSPITPSLDTNTIQAIETALFFDESQIPELNIAGQTSAPVPTAPPLPSPTPESSPSATPEVTPTPSPTL